MICFRFLFFLSFFLSHAGYSTHDTLKVVHYIEKYSDLAIEQEIKYGIPAVVTLAQAILESDAGTSLLTQISNNHFGIKSHKEWQGESVYYHDDSLNEKFRKYSSIQESYEDHSMFLISRPRYRALFCYKPHQWMEWCFGLQECGYASSKDYAAKLISIIEKYKLYSIYIPEKLTQKAYRSEIFPDIAGKEIEQDYGILLFWDEKFNKNLFTFAGNKKNKRPKSDY